MPERSPRQREADRASIARWYLEHVSQSEMARRLKISQPMVHKEVKKLREAWRTATAADTAEAMQLQLDTLEHVEREAWEGWHRSRRTAVRQTKRKKEK